MGRTFLKSTVENTESKPHKTKILVFKNTIDKFTRLAKDQEKKNAFNKFLVINWESQVIQ